MSVPRAYGSIALTGKPKKVVVRYAREASAERHVIGPSKHACGASCCLTCRRAVDRSLVEQVKRGRRAVAGESCDWCGRMPEPVRVVVGIDG